MFQKKIAVIWICLATLFSFVVIIVEIASVVKAPTIIYVDDVVGEGPGNPAENFTNIQDALDAASDGDTIFVYNGSYAANLDIDKSINLMGENKENTTMSGASWRPNIKVLADWINITGFTVKGAGIFDGWAGISLHYARYCNISNNRIVESEEGIRPYFSHNNTFANNEIYSIEQAGVNLQFSDNNTFVNNTITYCGYSGIEFYSSDNSIVVDNYISNCDYQGIVMQSSYGFTVINNTMIDGGILLYGTDFKHWDAHYIETSNTINGKPVYYFKNQTGGTVPLDAGQVILSNCTNMVIENLNLSYGSVGVSLGFSSNNIISNNTAISNKKNAVFLYSSINNTISNNTVTRDKYIASDDYCIYFWKSDLNNIIGNNLTHNDCGIYFFSSNNNTVINNLIEKNWNDIAFSSSNNNSIINNTISGYYVGIKLQSSCGTDIISNQISDNTYGLWLNDCSNNTIYHNNIVNNENQAIDNLNNNQWDFGYPSGGNFWSDYMGNDDYKGPNQNIPGNDGIGDTNYSIDTDSRDNYPLMFPVGDCVFLYEGWNLISIPFIQSNTQLGVVLRPIEGLYDSAQWYNVDDILDNWKHNHTSKPSHLNDLDHIDHIMGFWIHITEPDGVLFEYSGNKPTSNQTIALHPGWNLIGNPSFNSRNRTDALNNIDFGSDVDAIWTYCSSSQKWKEITASDNFEVGRGYWIHSKVTKVWIVPL